MVLTISCSSSAEFPPATIPDNFGVNTGITTMRLDEEDLLKMRKTGIRYVRFDLFWHEIERAKGVYIWGPFDRMIMSLKRHDLKPILILDYGNKLYQPEGGGIRTEEARQGFANFAAAAVARYNNRIPGIIWEVWNEPNSNNFWGPKRNADEFVALIKAAVPAMRKADPTATIVSGGILELFWSVTQAYLERCFELGLLKEVDGLGVHLYGGGRNQFPERILEELGDLRKRMAAHGAPPDYPVLNTEYGAGVKGFEKLRGPNRADQERGQAEAYVRMYLLTLLARLKLNIWYEWRWRDNLSNQAILNSDGSPRAIYTAIETLNDRFAGYTFERRIEQPGKDDYVLIFAKDGRRRIAAWTTGDPRTIAMEVASSAISLDTTGMLGESGSVEVRNGRFSANLTTSPIYIDIGAATLAR
jgi:hypothetical protein